MRTVLSLPQNQVLHLVGNLDEGREIPGREALELALPSRPDLRAFNARRDQAEFATRLANGEWKPSLAFRGNIQYQEDAFSNVLSSDNQNYTFGLAVQVPLMAAPGSSARRSVAQAQKRQAEYGLNASTDQARLELETAWTTLQAAAEVVSTQQLALELARESVQIAQVLVRERRDHVGRAERRAGAHARDRVESAPGEVREDRCRRAGEGGGGGRVREGKRQKAKANSSRLPRCRSLRLPLPLPSAFCLLPS